MVICCNPHFEAELMSVYGFTQTNLNTLVELFSSPANFNQTWDLTIARIAANGLMSYTLSSMQAVKLRMRR